MNVGRLDDAEATFDIAFRLSPRAEGANFIIGKTLLLKGEAERSLDQMKQESREPWMMLGLALTYYALDQVSRSDDALNDLIKNYPKWAYQIAYAFAYRQESDKAFEWLDQAVTIRDPGLTSIASDVMFTRIRSDSRWEPFLKSIGKSSADLNNIDFKVTLPQRSDSR
jgi:tetratricopeptide (TPR) repeat protein